jgi:membrane protein/epoxyqueuosine reductase
LAAPQPRSVPARLFSAGGRLLSREIAVLTNAIAFNFLLCLFPLMLVLAAVSQQLAGGSRTASNALLALLQELIPFGQKAMQDSIRSLSRLAKGLEVASVLLIVWGSSGIFIPMEMVLNRVWGGGLHRDFWKSRLLAFLMTVAGGTLVLLSVTLTVFARSYSRNWPTLAGLGVKASAFLMTCLLFFLIYRVIPDVPVRTVVALRAALWAGGGWEVAKYLFVFNLGRMNLEAFYGPLAFAVSLILWAYVSSLVLVFGALMSPVEGARRPGRRRPRPPQRSAASAR